MLNFKYSIPTEIYFGKRQIKNLSSGIKKFGSTVLLAYGGGSIKKNGIYDEIIKIFSDNNIKFIELNGIEPNPKLTSVIKGVDLCRNNNVDIILAVGGGSVIDCCKAIAAGVYYDGSPWDFCIGKAIIKKALPIGTILTLSATGSEMNGNAVISNWSTKEKLSLSSPYVKPKFSILDPTYTMTLPAKQTAAGTVDIISHVFEQYFSNTEGTYITDRISEAIIKTCIHNAPIAMENGNNYDARANLMWASSLALNELLSYGKVTDWATHAMEHELSAIFDITHGIGLGILIPHWMEYVLDEKNAWKFAEYGKHVWGIADIENKLSMAKESIKKTSDFFVSLGIPKNLYQVSITKNKLEEMASKAVSRGPIGNFKKLYKEDVLAIFKKAF
ncbi:iron-containing alcohol dehydrogenase [Clostridium rectalis]|uniref:iron-containing alcohol dehydrogenase n=1 Tax=Clostridium rectalis TaxID=2040295 RepID=UPI000F62FAF8|nr:iron-containing alcohol dehydrogenase [Clostridium rectalis]